MELLNTINTWLLGTALIPIGLFIIYFMRVKWWNTKVGIVLMLSKVSLFVYIGFAFFTYITEGNFLLKEELRLIVYVFLIVSGWFMFIAQRKIQKDGEATKQKLQEIENNLALKKED